MRLIGLWTEPKDVESFEREYLGSHVPKLNDLAGMSTVTTSRCIDGIYFRITEVHFHAKEELDAALETPAGRSVLEHAHTLAVKFGNRLDVLVVADAT